MQFPQLTESCALVVKQAEEEARLLGHGIVCSQHLLLALLHDASSIPATVLTSVGLQMQELRALVKQMGTIAADDATAHKEDNIGLSLEAEHVIQTLSFYEARALGYRYVGPEHLLLGLLRERDGVAVFVLQKLGADYTLIRSKTIRMIALDESIQGLDSAHKAYYRNSSSDTKAGRVGGVDSSGMILPSITITPAGINAALQAVLTPTLNAYGTDLTKLARQGKLDPIIGRHPQIERTTQILCRRSKNNPCLVGEPGVGKTAIVDGLAQRIANGVDVPEALASKRVISLDLARIVAGTRVRGEFEERLRKVVEEVRRTRGSSILFIDEVHTVIGAGAAEGGLDAANILKPAMARGELQCIGATTFDEYRKHIERDAALERHFQPVQVPQPSVEEAIEMLRGLRHRYEEHHQLHYTDEALEAAVQLSDQYISDRFLPDKAIDLIDEAGSCVRMRHRRANVNNMETHIDDDIGLHLHYLPCVRAVDIHHIVAAWTQIPVEKVSSDESQCLLQMEANLQKRVIGQDEAVRAISRAVRRARVGLRDSRRPIASFMFCGPIGVGKSELAKALAEQYCGSEQAMVRLDMSEFMERHSIAKLIGSPPGYVGYAEGGKLTEAVRRRPHTLILLDEIEKAHPDVFNIMLQILEDGRLTDSKGTTVDFKNTLLIMTSNVGSRGGHGGGSGMGFEMEDDRANQDQGAKMKRLVNEKMKEYFRPEFLNRVDEVIVFKKLTRVEVRQIAEMKVDEVVQRLQKKRKMKVEVTERLKERVAQEGYKEGGARPLRRAIVRLLEDRLAESMLSSEQAAATEDQVFCIVDVDSQENVTVQNCRGNNHL